MTKYLKKFELTAQYEKYINSDIALLPNVSVTNDDNKVHYNPIPNYLRFTAEEDNSTISLTSKTSPDIKYRLNSGEWMQWNYSTITLNAGDTIRMKGNNSSGFSTSYINYNKFQMTGKISASGNIMSLLYEDNFERQLTIPGEYCFYGMFSRCTSLTTAPELPATTLTRHCYDYMFYDCASLTTAPKLPATTLTDSCYSYMFYGCTSLTTAPELPATTLASYCYESMFSGCTKLNYIKMLATDISATGCLFDWVSNILSSGTFIKHPNMNSLIIGDSGIPYGWDINIEIDYCKFSIINNSNSEIIFFHNDGLYSPIKGNHIDLSYQYDENTIYSFTTEINLFIDIYKVSQDNIGILQLSNIIWESAVSLEELCYMYGINALDGIIIIINLIDNKYGDGYGYYYDYYYNYNPVLNYLTFTAKEDNSTIALNSMTSPDIKYSLNGGAWTQWNYSTITLNAGDTIRMKGNNSSGFSTSYINYNKFQMTGKISASGNIMSLLYEDNFERQLTIPGEYCYYSMFYGCTSLTTAPELPATTLTRHCYDYMFYDCASLTTAPKLPATTLTDSCYSYMFYGCTSLTTAPELPATTLADGCYYSMFYGCTSLTTAPELPATTLADGCYYSMFDSCTSLITAPELPATTLTDACYWDMFYGCTSLNYIKMLATDISGYNCLSNWVKGVASTGTFIKHPNMNSLIIGDSGIPDGWSVQDYSI